MTYFDDGSKKQVAGSFSVKGIPVNGKYRSLRTMSIVSESRNNLATLKVAVLQKYEHVMNQLACIVRCFLDLDFSKVMYCAGALIVLHTCL